MANALIRAGFDLTLEDETDPGSKHCEYAAISKHTKKRYWVEAKMRAVTGLLGRTEHDGGSDANPLTQLVPHLNQAFNKPAAHERMIFVDLNADMPDARSDRPPDFIGRAIKRLERYDANGESGGKAAYVFLTNIAFHRALNSPPALVVAPVGIGIPDFNKSGEFRVSERYRQEEKHRDALRVAESFGRLTQFPATFDGSLPSESFGQESSRVKIGETYDFGDVGPAKVTAATVAESEKAMYLGVTTLDGKACLLRQPMSDAELSDYRSHREAYFGVIQPVGKKIEDSYDLFCWLMDCHKGMSRAALLERMRGWPDEVNFEAYSDASLLSYYCEGMTASFERSRKD